MSKRGRRRNSKRRKSSSSSKRELQISWRGGGGEEGAVRLISCLAESHFPHTCTQEDFFSMNGNYEVQNIVVPLNILL